MGKKNNVLAWYLNKSSVFADFCNGCLYKGEKVVRPEALTEVQRANDEVIRDRNGKLRKRGRERDVAKLLYRNHHFVMIAVENQDRINYCMPLRCMEYDVVDFVKQLRRIKNRYKKEGGLETLEEYFETELRELVGMMKRRESKEEMRKYYEKNEARFRNMDEDTYDLICTMLDLKTLAAKKKTYRNAEKGAVDMCKAFDDLVKDGEKRGEKRGEEKLGSLVEKLVLDGRMADLLEVSKNVRKRKELYREYGI